MTLLELELVLKNAFIAADKLISAAHEAKADVTQLRQVRGNISIAQGALSQHIAAQPPPAPQPQATAPAPAPAPVPFPSAGTGGPPAPIAAQTTDATKELDALRGTTGS